MDPESKKHLDLITAKEVAALTEADIAFLRARSSYLTGDQRELYASVLAEPEAAKPLSEMTLNELKALAETRNIAIEDGDKKADIIAKLEAAQ